MATTDESLQLAIAHQQAGRWQEAEAICRQVLQAEPEHADALHLLGLLAYRTGRHDVAIACVSRAAELQPGRAALQANLGDIFRGAGNLAEAAECYRRGLALAGDHPELQFKLGTVFLLLENLDEAAACYREAVRLNPRFALAHHNLGVVLKKQDRTEEAIACYRTALGIQNDLPESYCALGLAQYQLGRVSEAADAFGEALRLKPDYLDVLKNYGLLLQQQGRLDEALACCQRVIQCEGGSASGYFRRASVYQSSGMRAEAIADYQEAQRLEPGLVDACNNLAVLYNDMTQPDAAAAWCRRGLETAPAFGPLYSNLAMALLAQGRADEALATRRRSIELLPDDPREGSNYLYDLNFITALDPSDVFAEHLKWAARFAEPLSKRAPPHSKDRDPTRRLRVGYVSPYFRQHAVNYFVEPILAAHDRAGFEVFCYSDVSAADDVTARVRALAGHWRDVAQQSDEELARTIRADAIDILVDLTGHIGGNRLLAFARKPAPIQVTYLGYQNTTGMSAMGYRLSDARADPPGMTDRFYSERLVRLPRAFFCYRPDGNAPAVSPPPARERGHITFGSFNNFAKVGPDVIDAWLRILARVPNSRLMVLASRGGDVERRLHALAAGQGIEPARIELFDKRPRAEYVMLVAQADIALDPFPFNGHTTSCDAVWMGLPVVMLEGCSYASRFGGSVLANVGLTDLIARTVHEYVERAVACAVDLPRLERLRGELRGRMAASPLLDFAGFTRHLEAAYRDMWLAWCGPANH